MTRVEIAVAVTALILVISFPWPDFLIACLIAGLLLGVFAGIWHDIAPLWRGEPAPAEDGDPNCQEKATSDA